MSKKPGPKKGSSGSTSSSGSASLEALRKAYSSHLEDLSRLEAVEVLPTGSIVLDRLLGIGGYPKGRITELWGDEGVSKTTLALEASANCQRLLGKAVVYADYEGAFTPSYAQSIGVDLDPSKFIYLPPDVFDNNRDALMALSSSEEVGLVVMDSVAAMTPKEFVEGGTHALGIMARNLGEFLSGFVKVIAKSKAACVAVNQVRTKIGVNGQPSTEYSPGGKALQFYNSIKVKLRRKEQLKGVVQDFVSLEGRQQFMAVKVTAQVTKNKFSKPFTAGEYWVRYGEGVDNASSIFDMAVARKVISKNGGWFLCAFPWNGQAAGTFKVQGEDNIRSLLAKEKDFQSVCLDYMKANGLLNLSEVDAAQAQAEDALDQKEEINL